MEETCVGTVGRAIPEGRQPVVAGSKSSIARSVVVIVVGFAAPCSCGRAPSLCDADGSPREFEVLSGSTHQP